jgi:hypothetical protein
MIKFSKHKFLIINKQAKSFIDTRKFPSILFLIIANVLKIHNKEVPKMCKKAARIQWLSARREIICRDDEINIFLLARNLRAAFNHCNLKSTVLHEKS